MSDRDPAASGPGAAKSRSRSSGGRSFGRRITIAVTSACGVAVLGVAVPLAIVEYSNLKHETFETARSQAAMVSLDTAAALVFDDPTHAEEALANLRAVDDVAAAVVFDTAGEVFARYQRALDPAVVPALVTAGEHEDGRWLTLSAPIVDLGERQGQLEIVYDLAPLGRRLRQSVLLAIVVSLGAMAAAWAVTHRVRRGLVAPIAELSRAANAVSETRDYSKRAARLSDDELGQLTDAFNQMLSQIEQQERDLQAVHAERGVLLDRERAARSDAERASRLKDEFLATLSHELRTPLTPIMGWIEIMKSGELQADQSRHALEVLERNARLLTRIIDDLLDMSRIVAGKIRLDVQDVELSEVIEGAIGTVRPAAEARSIRIQTELDPDARWVRGDASRLQQVVWNLLSNAIRFTPQGGRVEVRLARVGSQAEMTVRDNGQGIPPEFLPHVFDRFRQADSSISRQHGGLGLGLAIVRQLVELHGGSVRAESAGEQQGATFIILLPLIQAHGDGDPSSLLEPSQPRTGVTILGGLPSLSGLRVMVVEDDADARELLRTLLQSHGAEVVPAASGGEGLELLRSRRPDIVLSDVGMPEMDGYEFIRRVRRLPVEEGGAVPAIALTAFARSEDRTRALLDGYQLHLAKPVVATELVAALASLRTGLREKRETGTGWVGGTGRE